MIVTILGANSLLGQHLVQHIQRVDPLVELVTWNYCDDFQPRLPDIESTSIRHFKGLDTIHEAMQLSDVVINLHERQDLSLLPDESQLQLHNVDFIRSLLVSLRCPLVHVSSVFVQCSSRWPNVYCCEESPLKYKGQWPFPSYCSSRCQAEDLINKASVDSYILRCVPAYGEGDTCSVLTDLIKFADGGDITSYSDGDGVLQMAYAGNLADGIWVAANNLLSTNKQPYLHACPVPQTEEWNLGWGGSVSHAALFPSTLKNDRHIKETIVLGDDTPKMNIVNGFKSLLTVGKRNVVPCRIPFVIGFYIYYLFSILVRMLSMVTSIPTWIRELPHPCYGYLFFHHWTFFNTKKARLMLDYLPSVEFQEAMNRCQTHYRRLQPCDIPEYSWKAHSTS
ncbi:hypothetical protein Q1695_015093 [Nippostrongylus brasiliensis]|nr:hypothetical protein Q1695_015093 [Nippostrongylus brasiliensis]